MADFYRFEPRMEALEDGGQVTRKGAALYLEGAITPPRGWMDWDTLSYHPPQGFREQMEAIEGEELTVFIDSPGGDLATGMALYTALRQRRGVTRCEVTRAYSAATLALAGCDRGQRFLSPGATLLYHNPAVTADGDHRDMARAQRMLTAFKAAVVAAYAESSGMDADAISALMDAETMYTAREAVAAGWADGLLPASATMCATAPLRLRDVLTVSRAATQKSFQASLDAARPALGNTEREEILAFAQSVLKGA